MSFPKRDARATPRFPSPLHLLCRAKYLVLLLLVAQNTVYVLLMRYSRTRAGDMYLSSTAVCCDEATKLVTCLGILTAGYFLRRRRKGGEFRPLSANGDSKNGTGHDFGNGDAVHAENESFRSYMGKQLQFDVRMAGLALIYTVQKNLLYLAISNLDAAVFQVTYQLKVLTTAAFSVALLKRRLGGRKIMGLVLLTLSVALVQLDKVETDPGEGSREQRRWVGLLAVLGACCTSGFGGVYFELVLKPRGAEAPDGETAATTTTTASTTTTAKAPPSVWAKNVQLSAFGLVIALVTAFANDHAAIAADGFFQGYDRVVILVVALQALGGLVVAAVVKYADNILKSFATGVSIVTSTLANAWVFGHDISPLFVGGCAIQFLAIALYSRGEGGGDGRSAAPGTTGDVEMQEYGKGRISAFYEAARSRASAR